MYNLVGTILLLCVQSVSGVPLRIRGGNSFSIYSCLCTLKHLTPQGHHGMWEEGRKGLKNFVPCLIFPLVRSTNMQRGEWKNFVHCLFLFSFHSSPFSGTWVSREKKGGVEKRDSESLFFLSFKSELWISRKMQKEKLGNEGRPQFSKHLFAFFKFRKYAPFFWIVLRDLRETKRHPRGIHLWRLALFVRAAAAAAAAAAASWDVTWRERRPATKNTFPDIFDIKSGGRKSHEKRKSWRTDRKTNRALSLAWIVPTLLRTKIM